MQKLTIRLKSEIGTAREWRHATDMQMQEKPSGVRWLALLLDNGDTILTRPENIDVILIKDTHQAS